MWFWLSLTAGIASASEKLLNRIALKDKSNVLAYSFLYISAISLISFKFSLPVTNIQFKVDLLILVIIQAVFWSLGTLFSFAAQTNTDVSLSMIISRSRMLWMVPLGIYILGEQPSTVSFSGMLIIFLGLLLLFYKTEFHKHKGVHFMTLGSIFVAFGSTINALLVRNYLTPPQTTFITMFSQSLIFLILLLIRKNSVEKLKSTLTTTWYIIITAASIETFAFFGLNKAFQLGNASIATAVYLAMTITTVWGGIIFLKERDNIPRKIISSALVTIGIIVIKLFS